MENRSPHWSKILNCKVPQYFQLHSKKTLYFLFHILGRRNKINLHCNGRWISPFSPTHLIVSSPDKI